jgi:hypothetical protein
MYRITSLGTFGQRERLPAPLNPMDAITGGITAFVGGAAAIAQAVKESKAIDASVRQSRTALEARQLDLEAMRLQQQQQAQWATMASGAKPGLPVWAWVLIGAGALGVVGVGGYFLLGEE